MKTELVRRRVGLASVLAVVGALLMTLLTSVPQAQAADHTAHFLSFTGNITISNHAIRTCSTGLGPNYKPIQICGGGFTRTASYAFDHVGADVADENGQSDLPIKESYLDNLGTLRAVLRVHLQITPQDDVVVSPTLELYSGASCASYANLGVYCSKPGVLVGSQTAAPSTLVLSASHQFSMGVTSSQDPSDSVQANFSATHYYKGYPPT